MIACPPVLQRILELLEQSIKAETGHLITANFVDRHIQHRTAIYLKIIMSVNEREVHMLRD